MTDQQLRDQCYMTISDSEQTPCSYLKVLEGLPDHTAMLADDTRVPSLRDYARNLVDAWLEARGHSRSEGSVDARTDSTGEGRAPAETLADHPADADIRRALIDCLTDVVLRPIPHMARLRERTPLYTGERVETSFYVVPGFGDGVYVHDGADTSSADNGGSVIVTAQGTRYKREWGEPPRGCVLAWGLDPTGNQDNADHNAERLQALVDECAEHCDTLTRTVMFPSEGNFVFGTTVNMHKRLTVMSSGQQWAHFGSNERGAALRLKNNADSGDLLLSESTGSGVRLSVDGLYQEMDDWKPAKPFQVKSTGNEYGGMPLDLDAAGALRLTARNGVIELKSGDHASSKTRLRWARPDSC